VVRRSTVWHPDRGEDPILRTLTIACALVATAAVAGPPDGIDPVTVHVFHDDVIRFAPDDPSRWDTPTVKASDEGRAISRTVTLKPPAGRVRILARVTTRPIPKDVQSVHDPWDRAGNVQLVVPGAAPIEVVKFVTAYGGRTEHTVDVSHLAPVLRGECTFRGFVDTWVSPAWKMDFALTFEPLADEPAPEWMEGWTEDDHGAPAWVQAVLYEQNVSRMLLDEGPLVREIEIPPGTGHVVLHYFATGHCTDGRGADEFETKDHVLTVDGEEIRRLRPWRDDCRDFRDVNPYCRRWFDGSWSSDFDRSGWCPGDVVEPVAIDVTEALPPGPHTLDFFVEDVRPRDNSGSGYWRLSAYLLGWKETSP